MHIFNSSALRVQKSEQFKSGPGKEECGRWLYYFQGKQVENIFAKPNVYLFNTSLVFIRKSLICLTY